MTKGKIKSIAKENVRIMYQLMADSRDTRLKETAQNVYKHNHQIRRRVIERFVKKNAPFRKGIDIGTGTGVWAEFLSKYCSDVLGIDFVKENIRIASRNADKLKINRHITYILDDAEQMNHIEDDCYDIAIQVSVFQHLEKKKQALRRVNEILKNGGVFVILVHNSRCIYNLNLRYSLKKGNSIDINEYSTSQEMKAMLSKAGFEVEEIRYAWLFINDFLFLGSNKRFLQPFAPLRIVMIRVVSLLESFLNRFPFLNRFFREIVIMARKV